MWEEARGSIANKIPGRKAQAMFQSHNNNNIIIIIIVIVIIALYFILHNRINSNILLFLLTEGCI